MPSLRTCLTICLALASWSASTRAEVRTWDLDPVHTRLVFAVDHAGFSKALGTLAGATGVLVFDPDDPWTGARVEVQVPLARLDLGDGKWNEATLARRLLDAQDHPTAGFVSTRIEPVDARRATMHGLLTLRGETREIALDVVLNAVKRHPMPPFRRTAGFSATATLRRSDFGIDAWPSMIGDTVDLRIEAEATLSRKRATSPEGEPDTIDPTDTIDMIDAPETDPDATPEPDAVP